MSHSKLLKILTFAIVAGAAAAGAAAAGGPTNPSPAGPAADTVRYGTRVPLGDGEARVYLALDADGRPTEVGIALDEQALEGLPAEGAGHHGGVEMPHTYLLDLPTHRDVPFRFVELNWNPSGHEPEGVYQDVPHFDFHFYTISQDERASIVPTRSDYVQKANRVPGEGFVPAHNVALGPPGASPAEVAVPLMGVHWLDVRSPELQAMLGNPAAQKPFTKTFIHGSWDGRLTFWEPMITRAYLLQKKSETQATARDEIIPIPMPQKYPSRGYYPEAYRITWDPMAREYRVALTQLAPRS